MLDASRVTYRVKPEKPEKVMANSRTIKVTLEAANDLSQEVMHVDATEAWRRLRSGEAPQLEGTLFESKLGQMMTLLNDDQLPQAAE